MCVIYIWSGVLLCTLKTPFSVLCGFNKMNRAVSVTDGASQLKTPRKTGVVIDFYLVFVLLLCTSTQAQMLNDYPEVASAAPEVRQEAAGAFIKLKCYVNPCHGDNIFRWEYKACGPNLNAAKCHNAEHIEWAPVTGNIKSNKCTSTHAIKNATGSASGLYRCSKVVAPEDTRLVKVFELRVIDRYPFKNGEKPRILDILPGNISTIRDSKIVIQCKAYSVIPPEIWWLRQIDLAAVNFGFVMNNTRYINLKTSQKSFVNHTYVSKLIIEKSIETDTGIYTCFAISMSGYSDRDVVITVLPPDKEWQEKTSFLVLFLIPFCFALIPLTVWLCICYYRKKKLHKQSTDGKIGQQFKKYQPVTTRSTVLYSQRFPNHTSQGIV